jgi:restriction system protein
MLNGRPVSEMPTWDGFLVPVLRVLSDGQTWQAGDLSAAVATQVELTPEQRAEKITSGQPRYRNRVGWAVSSLARAGALTRPKRGTYTISDMGREILSRHPETLVEADLFPDYRKSAAKTLGGPRVVETDQMITVELDPLEQIDAGVHRLHEDVAAQLLDRLRAASPEFLEQSVLDVLVAMGYGGVEQRAQRIGGSHDGGVDGVIDQDPLGLARVYVQAKRYVADNVVGRPQIQGFVGALHGHQASQGVFITTSSFTREAAEYARSVNASVVLIDGTRFADLMIKYGVGVQARQTYTVVEIDEDYFE